MSDPVFFGCTCAEKIRLNVQRTIPIILAVIGTSSLIVIGLIVIVYKRKGRRSQQPPETIPSLDTMKPLPPDPMSTRSSVQSVREVSAGLLTLPTHNESLFSRIRKSFSSKTPVRIDPPNSAPPIPTHTSTTALLLRLGDQGVHTPDIHRVATAFRLSRSHPPQTADAELVQRLYELNVAVDDITIIVDTLRCDDLETGGHGEGHGEGLPDYNDVFSSKKADVIS